MITVQLILTILIYAALTTAILPPRMLSFHENALQEKRESITLRKLAPHTRFAIRVRTVVKNAGFTMRLYFLMTLASVIAGTTLGIILFNGIDLGIATGIAFMILPYFYMIMRGQIAARKELEHLENAMSIITNAYMGCNDIVEAFYGYTREKNRNRDPSQLDATPFDEFVTAVTLINPDVEHALYILEAKIRNYHFSEWVKMLLLCNRNHSLKFALPPIVKAMGDAKAMQIESDTQMSSPANKSQVLI